MKKAVIFGVLALMVLFPPCDYVKTVAGAKMGSYERPDEVVIVNEGWKPLWQVGGNVQIRWGQLGLQMGLLAVGAALLLAGKKKTTELVA